MARKSFSTKRFYNSALQRIRNKNKCIAVKAGGQNVSNARCTRRPYRLKFSVVFIHQYDPVPSIDDG